MVNYGNSMIYKLCCKDTNILDIYIGSTTNFYRRKSQHKNNCNNINSNCYNNYKYQFIRNNGDFENWDMILIKNVNVSSKRELEQVEREYIDELKPTLNSYKSYTSTEEKREQQKEYRDNNKEKLTEYNKEYKDNNKDKLNQKNKEYRDNNKEKIKEYNKQYNKDNKDRINQKMKEYNKKYYVDNKDELKQKMKEWYENNKEKQKEWYENNKEKIKEYQKEYKKEKINCPICNCLISKQNIKQHQRTKKCMSCKN